MDRNAQENPEIQRLIRLSQASRSCLGSEVAALRHRLDFPSRVRTSLKEHPSAWMFGSLASGLAASLIFRRRPPAPKKRRGISGSLLGLTLTAARPLAKIWLAGQLKHWAAGASSIKRPSPSALNIPPNPPHVEPSGPGPR
jgi:hypothetical protein